MISKKKLFTDDEGLFTIGSKQYKVLEAYQKGESALLYVDQAAKYASFQTLYDLGQKGGYYNRSQCGEYLGYSIWVDENDCYPVHFKYSFKKLLQYNLDQRLKAYSEVFFPKNNYEFSLSDSLRIAGIAIKPIFVEPEGLSYTGRLEYFPVVDADIDDFWDTWGDPRSDERTHEGVDIFAPIGTLIVAVKDGIIMENTVGCNEYGGDRLSIVDINDENTFYYYAHFDEYEKDWQEGDIVKAGEILGTVGDTIGCYNDCYDDSLCRNRCELRNGIRMCGIKGQTEPHLHFGVYQKEDGFHSSWVAKDSLNTLRQALGYSPITTKQSPIIYSVKPSFRIEVNYNLSIYNGIFNIINETDGLITNVIVCEVQGNDLDDCVNQEINKMNNAIFDFPNQDRYFGLEFELNCDSDKEKLFYAFMEGYFKCLSSIENDCVCNFSIDLQLEEEEYEILIYQDNNNIIFALSDSRLNDTITNKQLLEAYTLGGQVFMRNVNDITYDLSDSDKEVFLYKDSYEDMGFLPQQELENLDDYQSCTVAENRMFRFCVNTHKQFRVHDEDTGQVEDKDIIIKFALRFPEII